MACSHFCCCLPQDPTLPDHSILDDSLSVYRTLGNLRSSYVGL